MSNKLFTSVPVPKFPRSNFNLSRPVLFTPRMHKEYPTEIIEIIPGDGIKIHTEAYAKSQPMVAPTFAKMDVAEESFFVPCWQIHQKFDDFITGGDRGTYNDKMPYVTVHWLSQKLRVFFQSNFGLAGTETDAPAIYDECLTYCQDIIESLDIMRSCPIVLGSFQLMNGTWSATIATANRDAFRDNNQHLNNSPLRVNLLPFGAVLKIWSEFYRDENLCDDIFADYWKGEISGVDLSSLTGDVTSNLNTALNSVSTVEQVDFLHNLFGLKSRAWKKDYFTSALPFVQKGPDVQLPIGGVVPVDFSTENSPAAIVSGDVNFVKEANNHVVSMYAGTTLTDPYKINGNVDLSNVVLGSSIQDVRTAFKLEEMYEADGRFGSRYPENMLGQFGVHTPDARLPRCQFLGSKKQPVSIQQVVQNSSTDVTSPQGNLAGLSQSYGSGRLAKTYQSQHGFLVCLTAIRVHSLYQQGIHPMFSRYDRTEYAWPRFAHLGEQPIFTKQLFVDGTNVTEDEVFGYTPRYADYKSDTGSIHGKLKSDLNYWTMARRFGNKPVLNFEFIYGRPRQDAFVVTNHLEPCFIMELDYHVKANRVLPFYGQPHM